MSGRLAGKRIDALTFDELEGFSRRGGDQEAVLELSLEEASDLGCRACGSPGGGCQFLGTAATAQVVGEALGRGPLQYSALFKTAQRLSARPVKFGAITR